jgi:hypothetical protein
MSKTFLMVNEWFWFFWICCSFDQQYKDTLPHVNTQEQNNPFIGVQ